MHVVQAFIDVAQSLAVRDVLIDHEIAMHVSVNKARQLCAAFHTAESRTLPLATSDELERASRDFLTRLCNADDRRDTPAFVTSL